MSYIKTMEYKLLPEKSFEVVKRCSGCGTKANFVTTDCFRVNANGNRVDIWLIYQCKTCKHTWNMTIYERRNPKSIPKPELEGFMSNSNKLAKYYGNTCEFFSHNKAEIDWNSICYTIEAEEDYEMDVLSALEQGDTIIIHNPFCLKVRVERLLSDLFNISRTKVKEQIKNNVFQITTESSKIVINRNKMSD